MEDLFSCSYDAFTCIPYSETGIQPALQLFLEIEPHQLNDIIRYSLRIAVQQLIGPEEFSICIAVEFGSHESCTRSRMGLGHSPSAES